MQFKKYDKVVTADDVVLGDLLRIHHREEDVNPELRLYASYLEVWSVDLGGHIYIPSEYIEEYDAAARTIYIAETLSVVQQETWDRAPSFIAGRQSRKEELPIEGIQSIA
ncbi:hypothetical protein [Candidatus Leptofilum sp.]|uniref:hypothetical protein n=1 Tax=Candidatus Leptofilum sp. TaxID=3241576 RepID=UPI003B5A2ABF